MPTFLVEGEAVEMKWILFPDGVANIPPSIIGSTDKLRETLVQRVELHFSHNPSIIAALRDSKACVPTILYPNLDSGRWIASHRTLHDNFIADYIAQLTHIVGWLNAAHVSHNDLLPRNILWSVSNDGKLSVVLIDFEDACFFDEPPPVSFVPDNRYPLVFDIQPSADANYFFLFYIEKFVNQRETYSFADFMKENVYSLRNAFQEKLIAWKEDEKKDDVSARVEEL
jgi:serine/threonine protein kinase